MSDPQLRVFVLLGTDYHAFDRAVTWLDEWQANNPDAEVFIQHGSSTGPAKAGGSAFLDRAELQGRLESCDLVVSHGGPATISEARAVGHLPIVLPRDPSLGEHVDDHQLRYSRWAQDRGLVRRVTTQAELFAALDEALADPEQVRVDPEQVQLAAQDSVRHFGQLVRANREGRMAGQLVVGYIAGFGRSGSTLLERLLGQTAGVACLGEVVHLWQRGLIEDQLCACGEPFSQCPEWVEIGKQAFGGWDNVDARRVIELHNQVDRQRQLIRTANPFVRGETRKALREYTQYYTAIYRAAANLTGAKLILDSSKHVSLAFALTHDPDLDLRILHMVRDPRAVAYSWSRHIERPETSDGEEMPRFSTASSSLWWLTNNGITELLRLRRVPSALIHYEDLVRDPQGTLRTAATTLDLPVVPVVHVSDTGIVHLDGSHSVAGNPMRFNVGDVPLRQDEAWRTEMPAGRRRLAGALTAPLNVFYARHGRSQHQ